MIFFDLNTAQLARIAHELTVESNWSIQLIDSYVKKPDVKVQSSKTRVKTGKQRAQTAKPNQSISMKSFDEIFYICQFKRKTNTSENNIKLQQGKINTFLLT